MLHTLKFVRSNARALEPGDSLPGPWSIADRTAPLPRVVWIELTSRCPYDCPFCSRKTLRGQGANMSLALYRKIVADIGAPEVLRLNYSGESSHHPHVVEAIRLAAVTGAWVELVSVPAALQAGRLTKMIHAGLNRLTVSLHTLDAQQFREIYGFGTLSEMLANVEVAAGQRGRTAHPFVLDFAFVATATNLSQLDGVVALARRVGIPVVAVHPVIRRVDIPRPYDAEREPGGDLTRHFRRQLASKIDAARATYPEVALQVSTPEVATSTKRRLGTEPGPWPGALPFAARLHSCDQDPFETLHILADGRVVTCEVRDTQIVGDLTKTTLTEVWNGDAMRTFRVAFASGLDPACRDCAYKRAYLPSPPDSQLTPMHGLAQLLYGWHAPEPTIVWSKANSALTVARPAGARTLKLVGILPGSIRGPNTLTVRLEGERVTITNHGPEPRTFDRRIPLRRSNNASELVARFTVAQPFRPVSRGGNDVRELGFALATAAVE